MTSYTDRIEMEELPAELVAYKVFLAFMKNGEPIMYLDIWQSRTYYGGARTGCEQIDPTRVILVKPDSPMVETCSDCDGKILPFDRQFTEPPENGQCTCWTVEL